MKKIIWIVTLLSSFLYSYNNEITYDNDRGLYIVVNEIINIRDEPTTKSDVLYQKYRGNMLLVDRASNGGWLQLENGKYIYKNGIKKLDPNNIFKLKIVVTNARIRSKPSVKNGVVVEDGLKKDSEVFAIEKIGKWYLLIDGNYIWANSVSLPE